MACGVAEYGRRGFITPSTADLCAAATSSPLLQAMNGLFDVVVMTDGALVESLMKGTLKMDLFHTVVFDECHHVTKSSRCQQILAKVGEVGLFVGLPVVKMVCSSL